MNSSPNITFIHGFLGHPDDWSEVIELLPGEHQCKAISLPSCDEQVDFVEYCQGLSSQIEDNSIIVGYSLGARLALGIALNSDKKINRLILESGNPGIAESTEREQRLEQDNSLAKMLTKQRLKDFLERWYSQEIFSSLRDRRKRLVKVKSQQLNLETTKSILLGLTPAKMPNFWPQLNQLSMPCLYISGELDEKYCRIGAEFTKQLPNSEHRIVGNTGHNVHLENPAEFSKLLMEFIS